MSRAAGVRARQAQRELVRLARRVHEVAHVERRAASSPSSRSAYRVEQVVQIARVRVQHAHLRRAGLHDARMTVADVRHVVVRVDVASALVVVQVLLPAAHDLHRIAVRDAQIAADRARARRERLLSSSAASRESARAGTRAMQVRIGTERRPRRALRRRARRRESRCRDRADR